MARLVGINHVALEVGGLEEALAWYARLFDFELRGRIGDRMAFIDMGDQFLALASGRAQPPDGARHFVLVVDDEEADGASTRHDDLRAVVFNGTTKRSPEISNTDGLVAIVRAIFKRVGVELEEFRTVNRDIPPGLWPDMREHGYDTDEFPEIYKS